MPGRIAIARAAGHLSAKRPRFASNADVRGGTARGATSKTSGNARETNEVIEGKGRT